LNNFTIGDGSWQKRLDAGRCPKCEGQIVTQLVPDVKKVCEICNLTIIDSSKSSDKIKDDTMPSEWESDMEHDFFEVRFKHETKLMPTEEDIAGKENPMEWSVAVRYVEAAIHEFTRRMREDPDTPDTVLEEDLPNLTKAWNRILRG